MAGLRSSLFAAFPLLLSAAYQASHGKLAQSQISADSFEEMFRDQGLELRLLPQTQVVFEFQAPRLELEVRNLRTTEVSLEGLFGPRPGIKLLWSASPLVMPGDGDLVVAFGYGTLPAKEEPRGMEYGDFLKAPLRWRPFKPGAEAKELLSLGASCALRLPILTRPQWHWAAHPGRYWVRVLFNQRFSQAVDVSVIQQELTLPAKLPERVASLFRRMYDSPCLQGQRGLVVPPKAIWTGTETTWHANRPFLAVTPAVRDVCTKYRQAVIETIAANMGNHRIRPELFALAAETEAEELVPPLIDLLSEYQTQHGGILSVTQLDLLPILGTFERMVGKVYRTEAPQTMRRTGFVGMWWVYLRSYCEVAARERK